MPSNARHIDSQSQNVLTTFSEVVQSYELATLVKPAFFALRGSPGRANPGTGTRLFLCLERLESTRSGQSVFSIPVIRGLTRSTWWRLSGAIAGS